MEPCSPISTMLAQYACSTRKCRGGAGHSMHGTLPFWITPLEMGELQDGAFPTSTKKKSLNKNSYCP